MFDYAMMKKIIFNLSPENAHRVAEFFFKNGANYAPFILSPLAEHFFIHDKRLEQNIFGKTFLNPLGLAAGFDKNFMQTLLFLMNYLFGGLVFYGGLIGAFLGIFCYCKQYHLSYVPYMDVFAPLIPFVHGIGRIGCFCSGCCYGIEYHGPFAIQFPYNEAVPQLSQVPRFPVQLLEALMNFLLCGILFCLMKKKNLRNGRLMGIYLI